MLRELGFSENTYSEIILVVTRDGEVNAAPIGVKLINDNIMAIIFKDSVTYLGLMGCGECTINVTSDARVFYKFVMNERIGADELLSSDIIHVPALKIADAVVEAKVADVIDKGDRAIFYFVPVNFKILRSMPRTFNRAHPAIIEALVHYTRIKPYLTMGLSSEIDKLLERIKMCVDTVRHSTRDTELLNIANDILLKAVKDAKRQ
ncbi:MAG: DUF447 family protein [Thermoprotei archaeon]